MVTRRILCPFVADALSHRTLDAALRVARAENLAVVAQPIAGLTGECSGS
jgi:hypothetical protein